MRSPPAKDRKADHCLPQPIPIPSTSMKIELRPFNQDDLAFLRTLYTSSREKEMAMANFDDVNKTLFISQQFNAQHSSYLLNYPNANFDLILRNGHPIGRLYVDRRPVELRIMDITLLPAWQNKGIGTGLMKDVQAEGNQTNCALSLHVENNNLRAQQWYIKLGFRRISASPTHSFMVWPEGANVPIPVM